MTEPFKMTQIRHFKAVILSRRQVLVIGLFGLLILQSTITLCAPSGGNLESLNNYGFTYNTSDVYIDRVCRRVPVLLDPSVKPPCRLADRNCIVENPCVQPDPVERLLNIVPCPPVWEPALVCSSDAASRLNCSEKYSVLRKCFLSSDRPFYYLDTRKESCKLKSACGLWLKSCPVEFLRLRSLFVNCSSKDDTTTITYPPSTTYTGDTPDTTYQEYTGGNTDNATDHVVRTAHLLPEREPTVDLIVIPVFVGILVPLLSIGIIILICRRLEISKSEKRHGRYDVDKTKGFPNDSEATTDRTPMLILYHHDNQRSDHITTLIQNTHTCEDSGTQEECITQQDSALSKASYPLLNTETLVNVHTQGEVLSTSDSLLTTLAYADSDTQGELISDYSDAVSPISDSLENTNTQIHESFQSDTQVDRISHQDSIESTVSKPAHNVLDQRTEVVPDTFNSEKIGLLNGLENNDEGILPPSLDGNSDTSQISPSDASLETSMTLACKKEPTSPCKPHDTVQGPVDDSSEIRGTESPISVPDISEQKHISNEGTKDHNGDSKTIATQDSYLAPSPKSSEANVETNGETESKDDSIENTQYSLNDSILVEMSENPLKTETKDPSVEINGESGSSKDYSKENAHCSLNDSILGEISEHCDSVPNETNRISVDENEKIVTPEIQTSSFP